MLHLSDPLVALAFAPDINGGGCIDGAALSLGEPTRVTVFGAEVSEAPSAPLNLVGLRAFSTVAIELRRLDQRLTALEAAVEGLAARLQELAASQ